MTAGRPVAPNADPRSRCGTCGKSYNPYRHSTCPVCYVDDGEGYWLGCEDCGYDWLTTDSPVSAACPRCDADSRYIAERLTNPDQ